MQYTRTTPVIIQTFDLSIRATSGTASHPPEQQSARGACGAAPAAQRTEPGFPIRHHRGSADARSRTACPRPHGLEAVRATDDDVVGFRQTGGSTNRPPGAARAGRWTGFRSSPAGRRPPSSEAVRASGPLSGSAAGEVGVCAPLAPDELTRQLGQTTRILLSCYHTDVKGILPVQVVVRRPARGARSPAASAPPESPPRAGGVLRGLGASPWSNWAGSVGKRAGAVDMSCAAARSALFPSVNSFVLPASFFTHLSTLLRHPPLRSKW